MISSAGENWVKRGINVKLIGTFPVETIYKQERAVAEVYFLNDPNLVGLRYPDNSRMAVSAGWLQYRDQTIRDAHHAMLKEYNKLAGILPKLRLKHRVQQASIPGKLRLKRRPARQSGEVLSAPPSNEGHAPGIAVAGPRLKIKSKPKLIFKK